MADMAMMKVTVLGAAVLAAALTVGCAPAGGEGADRTPPSLPPAAGPRGHAPPVDSAAAPTEFRYLIRLQTVTVEVPLGTISQSEQLWSYLNEEPVNLSHTETLRSNGLRVGVAEKRAWPDVVRVLEEITGQPVAEQLIWVVPGEPVQIVLKPHQDAQTIFTRHPDRTLSGADFPPGDNLLSLLCTLNDRHDTVVLTAVPQLRSARLRPRYVKRNGIYTLVNASQMHTFDALTFRVRAASGDLIVLGPGMNADAPDSVGKHFLLRNKEGVPYETALVLIPTVEKMALREVVEAHTLPDAPPLPEPPRQP